MAERYMVTRRWIKHKGKIYRKGELLPEDFTRHDRFRNIYPSRIGVVDVTEPEVPEVPKVPEGAQVDPVTELASKVASKQVKPLSSATANKGSVTAAQASPETKTTGTKPTFKVNGDIPKSK